MKYTPQEFSALTQQIYAAALEPGKWDDVLQSITRLTDGIKTHIFGHDFETNTHMGIMSGGYDPDFVQSYADYYNQTNLWAEGFIQNDAGIPIYSEAMCPRDTLEAGEFYSDWIKPQEDVIAGGGMLLFKENRRMIAFGGNIRRKNEQEEDEWMHLVAMLGPHLTQAFEISRQLSGSSIELQAAVATGPAQGSAVMMFDRTARIIYANPRAEQLATAPSPLNIGFDRKIQLSDGPAQERLDQALDHLTQGVLMMPQRFKIRDAATAKVFECRLASVNPADLADLRLALWATFDTSCLLMTMTELSRVEDPLARFARDFRLTEAETHVVAHLANGTTLAEIAATRGVSLSTTRNQIKSVMAKTETHRQLDLVRLMLARGIGKQH